MTETTTAPTFDALLGQHGITVPDLETMTGVQIPVLAGAQRQGDVGIFPRAKLGKAERKLMTRIPAEGIQVVRGEATGNTHLLHAEGVSWWSPAQGSAGDTVLGVLEVEEGAAFLIHTDEHGANGIAPGTYVLRGKREQAEEVRRVAD